MSARRAVQKKLLAPGWQVSSFMMDRALEAVVRQIGKLDRNQDIVGYSRNGKTTYIDRHSQSHSCLGDAASRPIDF